MNLRRLLGFNVESIWRGLFYGTAVGVGFVAAQYIEYHLL